MKNYPECNELKEGIVTYELKGRLADHSFIIFFSISQVVRKPVLGVSHQVRYKSGYAANVSSHLPVNLDLGRLLSMQRKPKGVERGYDQSGQ